MNSEIVLYQSADGTIKIDVILENETVWLTQEQVCNLLARVNLPYLEVTMNKKQKELLAIFLRYI
jgi:hypothetical protein